MNIIRLKKFGIVPNLILAYQTVAFTH